MNNLDLRGFIGAMGFELQPYQEALLTAIENNPDARIVIERGRSPGRALPVTVKVHQAVTRGLMTPNRGKSVMIELNKFDEKIADARRRKDGSVKRLMKEKTDFIHKHLRG